MFTNERTEKYCAPLMFIPCQENIDFKISVFICDKHLISELDIYRIKTERVL